jgi:hypothetical protein
MKVTQAFACFTTFLQFEVFKFLFQQHEIGTKEVTL